MLYPTTRRLQTKRYSGSIRDDAYFRQKGINWIIGKDRIQRKQQDRRLLRKMKNIAVILAGGIGARVGGNVPKQLLPLADGRSVLEHATEAFAQADCIDEVCIVMHPDYIAFAEQALLRNGWQKVKHIIAGGKERWESSVNAIRLYESVLSAEEFAHANILLHDAARPFVSQAIIANVCQALETHEAVTVAVPSTDTMYVVTQTPNPQPATNSPTPLAGRGQGAGHQHSTLNTQLPPPPFKGGWEGPQVHPPTRYAHACPDPASLPPALDSSRLHSRPARPRFASHRRLWHSA